MLQLGLYLLALQHANSKWQQCGTQSASRQDMQRVGFFRLSVEADKGPVINGALGQSVRMRLQGSLS